MTKEILEKLNKQHKEIEYIESELNRIDSLGSDTSEMYISIEKIGHVNGALPNLNKTILPASDVIKMYKERLEDKLLTLKSRFQNITVKL